MEGAKTFLVMQHRNVAAHPNREGLAMFPKQLGGSLVSFKGNPLIAYPTVETVGAGLVQEGVHNLLA